MKINFMGVRIDAVERAEARQILRDRLRRGRGTAVYTPNPIMVHRAIMDGDFAKVLNRGDLVTADGIGLVIGARILGLPPLPRTAGITLAEDLLCDAATGGYRVFLLGGRPGVAEESAASLKKRFPTLKICGTHHGYFSNEQSSLVCRRIRAASPHILFVCLGSPRQERWIDKNRQKLPAVSVLMGLGGALDVWSGRLCRAPRGLRRLGLEWAWRMLLEPRRLGGLLPISAFLLAAVRERLRVETSVPNLKKT